MCRRYNVYGTVGKERLVIALGVDILEAERLCDMYANAYMEEIQIESEGE
jgi:hypothetical protein